VSHPGPQRTPRRALTPGRGALAAAAAAVAGAFAFVLLLMMVAAAMQPPPCGQTPAAGPLRGVPARLVPLYEAAAARYRLGAMGAAVLAAINRIETGFGRDLRTSPAGAEGWMQFLPSTWQAWAVDADGDGRRDPYDPADAIFTAARYLAASGAPGDWRRAIYAYNHAGWYVRDVWAHAQHYAAAAGAAGESAVPDATNGTAMGDPAAGMDSAGVTDGNASAQAASAPGAQATCAATTAVGPLRARILQIARGQLGVGERPLGSQCTIYGPCAEWCAMFTTWVWARAGIAAVRTPANYYVPTLRAWAQAHDLWKPGAANDPQPGDVVVFSDVHVALVEQVLPGGRIATINGNGADRRVSRRGPADPRDGWPALGPAPITGYIAPPATGAA
jgi:hypothetical protein